LAAVGFQAWGFFRFANFPKGEGLF